MQTAILDLEARKNYIIFIAQNITGGNVLYFSSDGVTQKGTAIILSKNFSKESTVPMEEFLGTLFGDVESDTIYPSLYDKFQNKIFPQDQTRQKWVIYRCTGRTFPDMPINFKN